MRRNWSDDQLAEFAEKCRKAWGLLPWKKLDVLKLVRSLETAANPAVRIKFVEVSSGYMKGALAKAEPRFRVVNYIQGLMDKLIRGDRKAAEVFLEEIGHIFLHPSADVMSHAEGQDQRARIIPEIQEQEEEVEKFVWYLLAPISEVYSEIDPQRLAETFGMTLDSANDYCSHIAETRNRTERVKRPLPPNVIDFVARQKKKFTTIKRITVSGPTPTAADSKEIQLQLPLVSPSKKSSTAFLDEVCENCGQATLRMMGGCKQCLCGEEYGCS